MKRRRFILLLSIVLGLPFFAMSMAPAEVTRIQSQADKLIGQMEPGAANFDQLKDQVSKFIQDLRTGGQTRLALELQGRLEKRIAAQSEKKAGAAAERAEKALQDLQEAGADEQALKNLLDAQKKQIEELRSLREYLEKSNEKIQQEALKYSKMVDEIKEAAKEGPDEVIKKLGEFVGLK